MLECCCSWLYWRRPNTDARRRECNSELAAAMKFYLFWKLQGVWIWQSRSYVSGTLRSGVPSRRQASARLPKSVIIHEPNLLEIWRRMHDSYLPFLGWQRGHRSNNLLPLRLLVTARHLSAKVQSCSSMTILFIIANTITNNQDIRVLRTWNSTLSSKNTEHYKAMFWSTTISEIA